MNTWIVGNHPVGHLRIPYPKGIVKLNERGHIEEGVLMFYMKARIMAGQADISQTMRGFKDFQWLCREELQSVLHRKVWSEARKMLPSQ